MNNELIILCGLILIAFYFVPKKVLKFVGCMIVGTAGAGILFLLVALEYARMVS